MVNSVNQGEGTETNYNYSPAVCLPTSTTPMRSRFKKKSTSPHHTWIAGNFHDTNLPFYYWTLNECYSEESYPSFDVRPEFDEDGDDARNHPLCLHRLRINQREDSSIFVVRRAHLPGRHRQTIRQSFHRPGNYLASLL